MTEEAAGMGTGTGVGMVTATAEAGAGAGGGSASFLDTFFTPTTGAVDVDGAFLAAGQRGDAKNSASAGESADARGSADSETETPGQDGEGAVDKSTAKHSTPTENANANANANANVNVNVAKALQDTLDVLGLSSIEELSKAVKDGLDIKGKLGSEPVDKLLADAKKFRDAEQERLSAEERAREEAETPEETIKRLKSEKTKIIEQYSAEKESTSALESSQRALAEFNAEIGQMVDKHWGEVKGEAPEVREMLNAFLGVDNPANDIDITDKIAVRKVAMAGVEKFKSFLAKVRQTAVDNYAGGRGDIKPSTEKTEKATATTKRTTPATATATTTATTKAIAHLSRGDQVEDAFAGANRAMLEMLQKEQ